MHIKKMMNKIIQKDNKEDMAILSELFVDMVHNLKDVNPDEYKRVVYNMQLIANDGHLTEEQAKKWVSHMDNKDGSKGQHWCWDDTESVRRKYAEEYDPADFYASINMIYSDYYCPNFDLTDYINMAKDWLGDKDVGHSKTLRYYLFVVKD